MRAEPRFSGYSHGKSDPQDIQGASQKPDLTTRKVYDSQGDKQLDTPWDTRDGFEDIETEGFYDIEDDVFDNEDEMDAWTRDTDPSQDRQTTITATERAAFQTIFKNIRSKTMNARKYGVEEDRDPDHSAHLRAKQRLERVMGKSMTERIPQTRDEMETVVNRYPPSLRALAAKAVGLDYDEAQFEENAQGEEAINKDQLEELRKPIREEVEAKMRAADTDSELWDIMEKEVFPLIEKLGLEKAGKERRAKQHGRKSAIATRPSASKIVLPSEQEQTIQLEPIVHMGQEISPLSFYGPLYPSYLLLGLRLLDRSFAKPSPLTLSILPKIKHLGLISHVLGASTQLYNELLIVHWYRYDDFRGVINLLSEMEESGLNFNNETLDIISDIMRMQRRILNGERGDTLKALWRLPEFAPGRFVYWHKKIKRMISENVDSGGQLSY